MLLCSSPWQLVWYREEKEATARETASGQSAEERLRTVEQRKGTTNPTQSRGLERESGGPAAPGSPSCQSRRLGGERGPAPRQNGSWATGKAGRWLGSSAAAGEAQARERRQAQAVCSAHPHLHPSKSAAARLEPGSRALRGERGAKAFRGLCCARPCTANSRAPGRGAL